MSEEYYGILISFENIKDSEEYFSRSSFPKKATRIQRAGNLEKYVIENQTLQSQLQQKDKVIEILREGLEFEYRLTAFFDNSERVLSSHHRIGKVLQQIQDLPTQKENKENV